MTSELRPKIKKHEAMCLALKPTRITALPFAYEVSCRARTGSVLHKVSLHERLVIRPGFAFAKLWFPRASRGANDFGRHLIFNGTNGTPDEQAYQPHRIARG